MRTGDINSQYISVILCHHIKLFSHIPDRLTNHLVQQTTWITASSATKVMENSIAALQNCGKSMLMNGQYICKIASYWPNLVKAI